MLTLNQYVDNLASTLPSLGFVEALLFVCLCALTVHKIYNKFEFDPANFLATFSLLGAVPFLPFLFMSQHLGSSMSTVLISYSLFYSVLGLSIVLYRISPFHPLAKYPGPLFLKISKLSAFLVAYMGKEHVFFKKLHDKYGPCVRVGPNHLSIVDVNALPDVFGFDGMRKGPQYFAHDKPDTTPNIVTLRNVDAHRQRRKLWSLGFTTTALKDYQPTVAARVLQLAEELGKRASNGKNGRKSVDLAEWMAFFTYDFMGDLVFDGGFELMRDGDTIDIVETLVQYMRSIGLLEHIPWVCRFIERLSLKSTPHSKFVILGLKCMNERTQKGSTKKDLFHYITNEDKQEDIEIPLDQAVNDTFCAMVAGADTTSTILGGVFHYLLMHREAYERLHAEVNAVFPLGECDPTDSVKLGEMPYLNAVINETLRLQPAVPTALQRSPLEGSGGKWVTDKFIPENAAVYIPPYVMHRDPRYFSPSPNAFIPERWLDPPVTNGIEYTTNMAAFIPFSTGPANCAGRDLARMEMRMVVATLVQRFDMRLAEGCDPRDWENQLQDFFVMSTGKLPVVITVRN